MLHRYIKRHVRNELYMPFVSFFTKKERLIVHHLEPNVILFNTINLLFIFRPQLPSIFDTIVFVFQDRKYMIRPLVHLRCIFLEN